MIEKKLGGDLPTALPGCAREAMEVTLLPGGRKNQGFWLIKQLNFGRLNKHI